MSGVTNGHTDNNKNGYCLIFEETIWSKQIKFAEQSNT